MEEKFIALAGLIEYLLETVLTGVVLPEKYSVLIKRGLSLILGILVAFVFSFDISQAASLTPVTPTAGYLFTGVLLGLGSNVVHILFGLGSKASKALAR